jgi:hypothetical protein
MQRQITRFQICNLAALSDSMISLSVIEQFTIVQLGTIFLSPLAGIDFVAGGVVAAEVLTSSITQFLAVIIPYLGNVAICSTTDYP